VARGDGSIVIYCSAQGFRDKFFNIGITLVGGKVINATNECSPTFCLGVPPFHVENKADRLTAAYYLDKHGSVFHFF
jgi:hypothetical protein